MGDISVIARRISDKNVQYGFSGGGGYYNNVGARLLYWYSQRKSKNFPDYEDLIEYLFSLGETYLIGKPGSENGGEGLMLSHYLLNRPFDLGTSEREIFSKIAFIDYGYFFDSDEKWYYVIPGPFRIKIPLELIGKNLDERDFEFDFLKQLTKKIMQYILLDYKNDKFDALVKDIGETRQNVLKNVISNDFPVHEFYEKYRKLYSFFDDWVVVKADSNYEKVERIIVKENTEPHVETIFWE